MNDEFYKPYTMADLHTQLNWQYQIILVVIILLSSSLTQHQSFFRNLPSPLTKTKKKLEINSKLDLFICYSNWVMYRVSNNRGLEYNLLTYIRIRIHQNQATTYFMPEFLTKGFFFAKTAFFETPRCHTTILWKTTAREISCGQIKINKWKARCWGTTILILS